jgi:hypothetical protein
VRSDGDTAPAAVIAAAAIALVIVLTVVLRSTSGAGSPAWLSVGGPGFSAMFPAPPSEPALVGDGRGVETAVVGGRAYMVSWSTVARGTSPPAALDLAVASLAAVPATVLNARSGHAGPFATEDVTARLSQDYLHARLLVVGGRAYVVGELAPGPVAPDDLTRFLAGFDPEVS